MLETFRYTNNKAPKISVHRGGKSIKNYPENCLETIQYVNANMDAIYEIDVAKTKDGKLVLMHDNSIDRTTNGTGLVMNQTYSQLKEYNLVDDFGNVTKFRIPLFEDVLEWSKQNNVVLSVDIKRSVPQSEVIKAIKDAKAEDVCIIITYDLKQAKSAFALAPDMMLSVSGRNDREVEALLTSGIPTKNMIAFTGTRLSDKSLFEKLHDNDILCMLGTLGNLDKRAEARGDKLYSDWLNLGIDMLATDRPFAVAKELKK
ncbi:hypothetical protein GCM10011444_26710 [Winogradskyella haliclonae]|uniref:GP-PDE domain-containing protein n=1 Tax=Winogradskyella haliclonae TaxID=2048558 RepID=A0ABQ2C3L5_9FLAO|nr:hypothetical protein GCM10011444_26710 [Winogradskyella haliclonae]